MIIHYNISAEFFVELEMYKTVSVGEFKTHILCSRNFFSGNRAVYEIMWKNMVEPDRPQMTV
jgi:hypothetical protein